MRKLQIGIAVLCLAALTSSDLNGQTTCRAADEDSDHFLRVLKASNNNPVLRARFSLPLVTPTQITLVSDPVVCARAGEAMIALARTWVPTAPDGPPPTTPLYVFRVGTSYAVVNLDSGNTADADFIFYFSPTWNHTGIGASQ